MGEILIAQGSHANVELIALEDLDAALAKKMRLVNDASN